MNRADTALLSRIAERVMTERGFTPSPPPEAADQADRAREISPDVGVRDLRQLPWSSIDNPDSRDLDQIEAVEKIDRGVRLYVGIAEVDAIVRQESPIDRFAGHNTTSVYTGVRTFTMLPERLSFDLTSLVADRTRLAMVIETIITPDGEVTQGKIYPAQVQNRAKLDYPSVSAWLDGHGPPPGRLATDAILRDQLELQARIARLLAEARKRNGALDVDTAETRPVLNERGEVVDLAVRTQDAAGGVIEELMIASNRAVAQALDAAGCPSIRRVVKRPERWARIVSYAAGLGGKLPPEPDSVALSKFVDQMRKTHTAQFAEISLALVKLMGRGEYVAHRPGMKDIGHFGLATDQYTHATAPNRRYVDLITQRLLKSLAAPDLRTYDFDALSQVASHASEREAEAEKVERQVHKSAAAMLLSSRIGQVFDGIVTGASEKGTWARIYRPAVEGKVVSGERGLQVGDRVRVRLRDVNVDKGFIDFIAMK
jgi:exoribonuclease-2